MGLEASGGFGGVPLVSWAALRSWSLLTQTALEPWEARALVRLGIVRAAIVNKKDG